MSRNSEPPQPRASSVLSRLRGALVGQLPPFGAVTSGTSFDEASLSENRFGRLTEVQRQRALTLRSWAWLNALAMALLAGFTVWGVLSVRALFEASQAWAPSTDAGALLELTLGLMVLPVLLGVATLFSVRRLVRARRDVAAGRVEIVEGAISKTWSSLGRGGGTKYYLALGGQGGDGARYRTFETWRDVYAAAPRSGNVRLFILPRTRRVANFEVLGAGGSQEAS